MQPSDPFFIHINISVPLIFLAKTDLVGLRLATASIWGSVPATGQKHLQKNFREHA